MSEGKHLQHQGLGELGTTSKCACTITHHHPSTATTWTKTISFDMIWWVDRLGLSYLMKHLKVDLVGLIPKASRI